MQRSRRKFLKVAGLSAITLPFAGLLANSAAKCKDEVEYGGWKQYSVDITVRRKHECKADCRAGHLTQG